MFPEAIDHGAAEILIGRIGNPLRQGTAQVLARTETEHRTVKRLRSHWLFGPWLRDRRHFGLELFQLLARVGQFFLLLVDFLRGLVEFLASLVLQGCFGIGQGLFHLTDLLLLLGFFTRTYREP